MPPMSPRVVVCSFQRCSGDMVNTPSLMMRLPSPIGSRLPLSSFSRYTPSSSQGGGPDSATAGPPLAAGEFVGCCVGTAVGCVGDGCLAGDGGCGEGEGARG